MATEPAETHPKPKTFLSYSWSSPAHEQRIIGWANRLAGDGVEVVLDKYDLKPGQDKYVFMEQMVNDKTVTHVLVFSDKTYTEKANARKSGVGTESQIISEQLYREVTQTKFIPIICEKDEKGEPYLPAFISSRIWFDFSSEEKVNENWESLIRFLFGKPLLQKPPTATPPAYVTETSVGPANPAASKFATLRQAALSGSRSLKLCRTDFLDTCFAHIDSLRVKTDPRTDTADVVIEPYRQLIPIRNNLVDWVLLEGQANASEDFNETLISVLERMLEMRSRPSCLSSYREYWFDGHSTFVYECFLYFLAGLLRAGAYRTLNSVLMETYLPPESANRTDAFVRFNTFYVYSEFLKAKMRPDNDPKREYYAPVVELMKRHADRADLPFNSLVEADALALLASMMSPPTWWYPQTFYYASYGTPPFFIRAAQHRHFLKLATIMGVSSADEIRAAVEANAKERGNDARFSNSRSAMLNLDKLDTIR